MFQLDVKRSFWISEGYFWSYCVSCDEYLVTHISYFPQFRYFFVNHFLECPLFNIQHFTFYQYLELSPGNSVLTLLVNITGNVFVFFPVSSFLHTSKWSLMFCQTPVQNPFSVTDKGPFSLYINKTKSALKPLLLTAQLLKYCHEAIHLQQGRRCILPLFNRSIFVINFSLVIWHVFNKRSETNASYSSSFLLKYDSFRDPEIQETW